MWNGNLPCTIERLGRYDKYGQPSVLEKIETRGSIVRLAPERMRTAIRTDASASGGNAHEQTDDGVILINHDANPEIGDRITILGHKLKVNKIYYRYTIFGAKHHWQCFCSRWK